MNRPDQYQPVEEKNRWLGTRFGTVELGVAGGYFYVRTRGGYYQVPHGKEDDSRASIRAWVESQIQNRGITTPLYSSYGYFSPGQSPTKNNSGFQPYAGANGWLDVEGGRVKLGVNQRGYVVIQTRHDYYDVPPEHTSSRDAMRRWFDSNHPVPKNSASTDRYPRPVVRSDTSKIWVGQQNGGGSSASQGFQPLPENQRWLDTRYGQVVLGTNAANPGGIVIRTQGEGYYLVPPSQSTHRASVKRWIENAVEHRGITTPLYPRVKVSEKVEDQVFRWPDLPQASPAQDVRLRWRSSTRTVDEQGAGQLIQTSPASLDKGVTHDFTVRIQPWRGTLRPSIFPAIRPHEELFELKPVSTAGRPGWDTKHKWVLDPPAGLAPLLKKAHVKLELETSSGVRLIKGQFIGQGGVSFKVNFSDPSPGSLKRLVFGLEFPQFSAPLMPMVQRILPHVVELYQALTTRYPDPKEFEKRFNEAAAEVLVPITMFGGQISVVYPANNAIKKISGGLAGMATAAGLEPLAAVAAAPGTGLAFLEKTTGFNVRVGYTFTLRDPIRRYDVGNFDGNSTSDVYVVANDPQGKPVVRRLNFAREIFGHRAFDPTYSEYVSALRARGFNVFQAASLVPLDRKKPGNDGQPRDPANALRTSITFTPQRFPKDPTMQVADQLVSAIVDIRGRLPANALNTVPRVLNSYEEACQAVAQIRKILASYRGAETPGLLEKRFLAALVNRYGVDWGVQGLGELNVKKYGRRAVDPSLTTRLRQTPDYTVTARSPGEAEVVRDKAGKVYHFSVWNENLKEGDHRQKLRVGLVSADNPSAVNKSLMQMVR